jgi:hypothetical protein
MGLDSRKTPKPREWRTERSGWSWESAWLEHQKVLFSRYFRTKLLLQAAFSSALIEGIQRGFPVFGRGHFLQVVESPVKISNVIEANQEANFSDGFIGVRKVLTCLVNTKAVDEFYESMSGGFLKELREIRRADPHVGGHFFKGNARVVVFKN